jgi:glycosyltransferase involved in cell wall biosynthesis
MRVALFIDGTFIPERDGASTRFAQMPRHLSQQGMNVTVFHCYRGWSDLTRIAAEPFPTYFFPPQIFYSDLRCLVRIVRNAEVDMIQMNDAESIARIGFRLAEALDLKIVFEAHYHTSTLATALGATRRRIDSLKVLECDVSQHVDHLIVFTDEDRDRWITLSGCPEDRISVVPFGVNAILPGEYPADRQGLAFIGNIFYEPNRRAVERIVTEITPIVRSILPSTPVIVIGDTPNEVKDLCLSAEIKVVGEVADPLAWLAQTAVGLAPLLEPSGIRVKILQYLAAGMPVVAMPSAAEGLQLPALFVEDDSKSVALRCIDMLSHPERYESLVRNGKTALSDRFLWSSIARTALEVYAHVRVNPRRRRRQVAQYDGLLVPMWIEEALNKGRFVTANMNELGAYQFGLAAGGQIVTYQ